MKLLNRLLNIYNFFLVVFICIIFFINIFEPLVYNANTKGKELEEFENYRYILDSLSQYMLYYKENNIEALKKSTAFLKRKDESSYINVCESYIKENYKKLQIINISKGFNDVYIIEYSINADYSKNNVNQPDKHKLIIKINTIKESFQIFYDSLLESI